MRGFVINLDHRPDRFEQFQRTTAIHMAWLNAERVSGILGRDLEIDDRFLERVIPKYRTVELANWMRANFGCTLSHIKCWQMIAASEDSYGFVFEDDARLLSARSGAHLASLVSRFPADAGLIFLNDYNRPDWRAYARGRVVDLARRAMGPRRATEFDRQLVGMECALAALTDSTVFRRWDAALVKTTEAYAISRWLAVELAEFVTNNLGAIDLQIQDFFRLHPMNAAYEVTPPLFCQADRSDSDIRS